MKMTTMTRSKSATKPIRRANSGSSFLSCTVLQNRGPGIHILHLPRLGNLPKYGDDFPEDRHRLLFRHEDGFHRGMLRL